MEQEELVKRIVELPMLIRTQELKIIALNRKISSIEDKKKDLETTHFIAVLSARDGDNKNLYTNDKSREIEVNRRKKLDAVFQALILEEEDSIIQSKQEVAEFEFLKREFKVVELLVNLLKRC